MKPGRATDDGYISVNSTDPPCALLFSWRERRISVQ